MAAHLEFAYRGRTGKAVALPVTERLSANTLILPLYHQMTPAEQSRVIDALRTAATRRGAA
jgi:dTDP-4-amino-4,6-dideoxygalactose transaminase